MTYAEMELRTLESQLASLRHQFDDAATPILNRLAEIRPRRDSDRQLLIPRQARRRSPGTRLPRQF